MPPDDTWNEMADLCLEIAESGAEPEVERAMRALARQCRQRGLNLRALATATETEAVTGQYQLVAGQWRRAPWWVRWLRRRTQIGPKRTGR